MNDNETAELNMFFDTLAETNPEYFEWSPSDDELDEMLNGRI